MSIKVKLSIIFSFLFSLILILNNTLHYITTKDQLIQEQIRYSQMVARQIVGSIENYNRGSQQIEDTMGSELRAASVAAQLRLSPDYRNVTNEQLQELSKMIGVSHITLLAPQGDDIVGVRSSDPKEIGLSTKKWEYWFTAFQELLKYRDVKTVEKGQRLANYWSGPLAVSSSDPNYIDKWGYYYDGTTNYIINPYIRDESLKQFEQTTGPESIVLKVIKFNSSIFGISGFNPNVIGKKPITSNPSGVAFVKLADRPIYFGNYVFPDESKDVQYIQNADANKIVSSYDEVMDGHHLIKTFIPVVSSEFPLVIGFVTDYKVIDDILSSQLHKDLLISSILLFVVIFVTMVLSRYIVRPVYQLLQQVDEIAEGKFSIRIPLKRNDELGRLANRVNVMSERLESNTRELQVSRDQMRFQAHHDPLTGLPNRLSLNNHLNQLFHHDVEKPFGLLFLDIDRFKNINDTLGHSVGDQLLIEVAERLKKKICQSGNVYRLGGDEFTIVFDEVDLSEIDLLNQSILDVFYQPFILEGQEYFVTASIGVSVYPDNGTNAETLIKNADSAMYFAKDQGGNRYKVYTDSLHDKTSEMIFIENSLRKALSQEEFLLHYQPKMDIISGEMTGVEALLRWNHSTLGSVSPALFIPISEEIGIISEIGEWVLRKACLQIKHWHDLGYHIRIAVNLSIYQFREGNIVQLVKQVLAETGVDPAFLELEITESMSIFNQDFVIKRLHELRELGIQISIDDFGTGYSSLNYLHRLPVDKLKIDRSFVNNISKGKENIHIVKAIIAMAHSLNLRVIAEGVETLEQLEFLKQNGCHEGQGFYFSKPVTPEEIESYLKQLNKR
ncbi:MAG TPA: EAL domain-containing protein [Bacillota bacterium]|nr:EAL domain-containing protein [Bacillota bacterium]